MKSEEIKHLLDRFEAATQIIDGVECWSARDLQELLGFTGTALGSAVARVNVGR